MIVKNGLLIGRPEGMEVAVFSFLQVCGKVIFHRHLEEIDADGIDPPNFVLVLQHWSDEYTHAEVESLLNRFPLSRMVCCYGPWCQSDQRTRQVWPAAVRVSVDEVKERIELECQVLLGDAQPIERTAGLDELFAFQHQQSGNKIT